MKILLTITWLLFSSCGQDNNDQLPLATPEDTVAIEPQSVLEKIDSTPAVTVEEPAEGHFINTGNTTPEQLLEFAKTLVGTPYVYGSSNPVQGFDCSGFITYVFNHFNITVPRSSIGFTDYQRKVELSEAKPGDIILFTGTDHTVREVGHMGIITAANNGQYEFIHSSSGKAHGVTVTPLNKYYMGRFVKIIRVFKQND
jgi:cell wall-associated NlpC family hydrolase